MLFSDYTIFFCFFFFKQKTAYEMRFSDWSSDVCSSDLWSTAAKLAIIQETYEADATVSIVARRHGIQPNQLFAWRKLASQGAQIGRASCRERVCQYV